MRDSEERSLSESGAGACDGEKPGAALQAQLRAGRGCALVTFPPVPARVKERVQRHVAHMLRRALAHLASPCARELGLARKATVLDAAQEVLIVHAEEAACGGIQRQRGGLGLVVTKQPQQVRENWMCMDSCGYTGWIRAHASLPVCGATATRAGHSTRDRAAMGYWHAPCTAPSECRDCAMGPSVSSARGPQLATQRGRGACAGTAFG